MNQQLLPKDAKDYANESHIARKKRAEATQVSTKNRKEILEMIDIDEEEDLEQYARYIK
jgi:hypothetical protein